MIKNDVSCDYCKDCVCNEKHRPGFPQLTWCYYREGKRLLKDHEGNVMLDNTWTGSVNRIEFCQCCGKKFNSLLKAFMSKDSRLLEILNTLEKEFDIKFGAKQKAVDEEYKIYEHNTKAKDESALRKKKEENKKIADDFKKSALDNFDKKQKDVKKKIKDSKSKEGKK